MESSGCKDQVLLVAVLELQPEGSAIVDHHLRVKVFVFNDEHLHPRALRSICPRITMSIPSASRDTMSKVLIGERASNSAKVITRTST